MPENKTYISRLLLMFLFAFIAVCANAQSHNEEIKKNKKDLAAAKTDSVRMSCMNALCRLYADVDANVAVEYGEQALALAKKLSDLYGQAIIQQNLGNAYLSTSQFDIARLCYNKSLELARKLKDKLLQSDALNGLGSFYDGLSQYDKAIKCYLKSIKLAEEAGDSIGVAYTLVNVGVVYSNIEQRDQALIYYTESLNLLKLLNDKFGLGSVYGNIGNAYKDQKQYGEALKNLELSVKYLEETGSPAEVAVTLTSIAEVYFFQENYIKAMEVIDQAYDLSKKAGDVITQALCFCQKGHICLQQNKIEEGMEYFKKSFSIASGQGFETLRLALFQLMSASYAAKNNYKQAWDYERKYSALKDSLYKIQNVDQLHEMHVKYETEKRKKEIELARSNLLREQNFRYGVTAMAIAMLLLGIFIFRAYRIKKKSSELLARQNMEIEKQKMIVEEKQREIIDSINYASRIQRSLLPGSSYIRNQLKRLNKN
ncbi:MAG TPA: tetratricopeptide repeat protein [Flavobacteriales bacterium]|nr:tetratricopeptide repeat protein [Flavobacteriales bacterium]